jgi:hypothetical protein
MRSPARSSATVGALATDRRSRRRCRADRGRPLNSAAADVDLAASTPPACRRAAPPRDPSGPRRAGGVAGLGYGYQISRRVGVGAVGSINLLDGQRLYSLSPFVTLYPVGGARHLWFVEAGPHLARLVTP